MTDFSERYGPWALVAGASMGIGRAFSHDAARRGVNVVMLARGEELLRQIADEVSAEHGVEARPVVADLADPAIGSVVAAATDGLDIGLFVYNATIAMHGRFLDVALDDQLASVAVNCATPVTLVNLLGRPMVERGRGGIVLVSSNGGTAGAINFGTYNAGKAFQWILGETLWTELRDQGVDVTTIMVGPTSSPNFNAFQATLDRDLCDPAIPTSRSTARAPGCSTRRPPRRWRRPPTTRSVRPPPSASRIPTTTGSSGPPSRCRATRPSPCGAASRKPPPAPPTASPADPAPEPASVAVPIRQVSHAGSGKRAA